MNDWALPCASRRGKASRNISGIVTGHDRCDDCMDCFAVCPEPQVINPAPKDAERNAGPAIASPNRTRCGRCIDVCPKDVFRFSLRTF